jgi:hypothetical protein
MDGLLVVVLRAAKASDLPDQRDDVVAVKNILMEIVTGDKTVWIHLHEERDVLSDLYEDCFGVLMQQKGCG